MHTRTQPQVVVITGASAGIGRATARAFARKGARIGLLARGREALAATRREIVALGGTALVLVRVTMVHLSAFNTPQFGWVKSRLPRQAQPLPPVFQPEIAADAIVFAARHPRRQFVVGWPALKAILAQKFVPGIADRVLARQGYDGQQTDEPENPDRPHNLWEPLPGEQGAHGPFDRQARRSSWQWSLSKHRGLVAAGLLVAGFVVAGLVGVAPMKR